MSDPILSVHHLETSLQLGKQHYNIVEDLSFNLYPGKTMALVGESGCGKTMTALSIMGILTYPPALPPRGEIMYKGCNLLALSDRKMRKIRGSKIAMIFQDPGSSLNPVYTVGWQMAEVAELHLGLYGADAIAKAAEVLGNVGIATPYKILDAYPHHLSGGMKQRVMIAMALMCEPDVLIADEPTTALDVTIQAQVLQLIRTLQEKMGMAVLLITHDMGVVAEMAHDVIVMYAAQAVEQGRIADIFDDLKHPYTKALFDSRALLHNRKSTLKTIQGSVPSINHLPHGCRFHPRCPFVMSKCKQGKVPEFTLAQHEQMNHTANCWLYDGSEESDDKIRNNGLCRLLSSR